MRILSSIDYSVTGNYVNITDIGEYVFVRDAFNQTWNSIDLKVSFHSKGDLSVSFVFFESTPGYKSFTFNSLYFSNEEIIQASDEFNFKWIKNPYYPERIQGSLEAIHHDYKHISCLLMEREAIYFLLIYAERRLMPTHGASDDMPDVYYIHGVWEVELSDEFRQKVLNKKLQ